MRLIKGLSEERLLERIKKFNRSAGLSQRGLGFYLLDFELRGLYRKMGFSSTAHFALLKLHIDQRKTREHLRIARALEELTLIDVAFARGRLSFSAVREVTRVAVKETEEEWLVLAEKESLRRIEHAVSRAKRGDRPPKDPYSLSQTRLKVTAELPLEDYAVWKAAFDRLSAGCGGDLDASTAFLMLATSFLERPLDGEERAARKTFQVVYHRCSECHRAWVETEDGPLGIPARKVGWRERFGEVVRLDEDEGVNGRALAVALNEDRGANGRALGSVPQDAGRADRTRAAPEPSMQRAPAPDGAEVAKQEDRLPIAGACAREEEEPADGGKVSGNGDPRGSCGNPGNNGKQGEINTKSPQKSDPRGSCAENLSNYNKKTNNIDLSKKTIQSNPCALAVAPVPPADRDPPNTPMIRQQVLSRDGQCCTTPGCTNRGELFSHHVQWRSQGGRTLLINEVCVCQRCHSLIHEGSLRVEGTAPHGLRWYGADGKPLQAFSGCPHVEPLRVEKPRYKTEARAGAPRGAPCGPREWWLKYKHNFYWEGNRLMLKKRR